MHVDSASAHTAFSAALSAPTRLCSLCFTRVVESCLGSRSHLTEFLGSFCRCSPWSVLIGGVYATLPSWFFDEIVLQSFFCLPLMQWPLKSFLTYCSLASRIWWWCVSICQTALSWWTDGSSSQSQQTWLYHHCHASECWSLSLTLPSSRIAHSVTKSWPFSVPDICLSCFTSQFRQSFPVTESVILTHNLPVFSHHPLGDKSGLFFGVMVSPCSLGWPVICYRPACPRTQWSVYFCLLSIKIKDTDAMLGNKRDLKNTNSQEI